MERVDADVLIKGKKSESGMKSCQTNSTQSL